MTARRLLPWLALLALAGCNQPEPTMLQPTELPPTEPQPAEPAPIDRSINGAIDALQRYYHALNNGDYPSAYALWGERGAPSQSLEEFSASFADIAQFELRIGDDTFAEGAAGSIYATLPIELTVHQTNNQPQHWQGNAILRRVNDVPGASDAQLHWHLYSLDLKPVG
ncbi:hypothetical protein [Saccharospirillum mangrovi]|uniref:hypothetical protein n=1 Tax=Saccharospirillum mangrovi TaxID=2161747 RepID=UPI000D34F174|nr:hypothetical protein [Saccharospirillum mangrovi]